MTDVLSTMDLLTVVMPATLELGHSWQPMGSLAERSQTALNVLVPTKWLACYCLKVIVITTQSSLPSGKASQEP